MENALCICKDMLGTVLGFFLNLARETAALVTHTIAQLTEKTMAFVGRKCWDRMRKIAQPVLKCVMILSAVTAVVSGVCYLVTRKNGN